MSKAVVVLSIVLLLGQGVRAAAQAVPARPPLAACAAAAPSLGERFSGPVLQVIDARSVCVAKGPFPNQWIRVALTDAAADGSRGALSAAAFGRNVECVVSGRAGGAVLAVCAEQGVSIGLRSKAPEYRAQASNWR